MILSTFKKVGAPTCIHYAPELLQTLPCGLHRAPLDKAMELMPAFWELYESCPVPREEWDQWEIDLKIHMLMPLQYPCIPNWHCDNVPRKDGVLDYSKIDQETPPMYLWISSGPNTEFLKKPGTTKRDIKSHEQLAALIRRCALKTEELPSQQWVAMKQNTPHRGTLSEAHSWRVFVRLTHKSIASDRPVIDHIRRHCQVYLDARTFAW